MIIGNISIESLIEKTSRLSVLTLDKLLCTISDWVPVVLKCYCIVRGRISIGSSRPFGGDLTMMFRIFIFHFFFFF